MTDEEMRSYTKGNEGCRLSVYLDTEGYPTFGYGHKCTKGTTIPQAAVEIIFSADYDNAIKGYQMLNLQLDDVRRMALIDMVFQMGVAGVSKFERMLQSLREQDYSRAAEALLDSLYARQTPARANRNAELIKYGNSAPQRDFGRS
jgi:GH24 family phage-related lysozyme (muramidase)